MNQTLALYQVDAFTSSLFGGNPAAVVPLQEWPSDKLLQQIARENNLSETAFIVAEGDGYGLRWFTPAVEVDLCGHATLATAHVLFRHLDFNKERIIFQTRSGQLQVSRERDLYVMDFPADKPKSYDARLLPENLMGSEPEAVYDARYLMTIYPHQASLENLRPDFRTMASLPWLGVIATAPADSPDLDFVSRFFCPKAGIDEDPVTGSAHTILTPYWAERLNKNALYAKQISHREGNLLCTLNHDRVLLKGQAVTYLKGEISIPQIAEKTY
ncbi:PhzF family phenazine biosynthesis protein [Roseivirga sp. BDSF3-8]|uniref:PhzF family phenazine biosynthesis protein n=1 Tax=Roseivirga sp. BDSF3-8 TaxID=3241598 RepID=UPI003532191D